MPTLYSWEFAGRSRGGGATASAAHTDVPGPAGAFSFTFDWEPPIYDAEGNALGYTPWVRIEYGTVEGTYPYCKYIENGALCTGTVSGLASNTYYVRGVDGNPSTNQEAAPSVAIEKSI